MKILVSGFQRSGTTMTRRLLQYHPDVYKVLHERRLLYKKRTKKELLKLAKHFDIKNPIDCNWGDKVPFYSNGPEPQIKYIKKWNNVWEEEGRVIYLIRHPIDVAISTVKVKMGPNLKVVIKRQNNSVPAVVKALKDVDNVLVVSFESLVTKPREILKHMFEFCGLDYSDNVIEMISTANRKQLRYFDNINADRAFAYKRDKNIEIPVKPYNYKELRNLDYVL